jgi:hypothetical protein
MRVLVVAANPEWTPGTRLMATLAAGLAARGDVVAIATALRSEAERAVERTWPRLSVRSVGGSGWLRQALSLRGIITALRPDALLVGSEADAVLAAFAAGKQGGIVRRLAADERSTFEPLATDGLRTDGLRELNASLPWRARFALKRARITLWGAQRLALGWPVTPPVTDAAPGDPASVHRLPVSSSQVVLVPTATHDETTANALRALAHVRSRHADLRILLVGEPSSLQATRLHAAALDLSSCVQLTPMDALLHHELGHACAAWIAIDGDAGAVATLAAMQQGVPVVLPHDVSFTSLVTPGVTGFLAAPDSAVTVVAELARVLSDGHARRTMSDAAAAKAAREYAWDAFVDEAADLLARAGGVSNSRITRRPSLTPA